MRARGGNLRVFTRREPGPKTASVNARRSFREPAAPSALRSPGALGGPRVLAWGLGVLPGGNASAPRIVVIDVQVMSEKPRIYPPGLSLTLGRGGAPVPSGASDLATVPDDSLAGLRTPAMGLGLRAMDNHGRGEQRHPVQSQGRDAQAEEDERGQVRAPEEATPEERDARFEDRKSTRLNSSHVAISYAVFCLK